MGLRPTQGNEKLHVASCLSSRAERPQGAESRDLHFSRLPRLSHVLRMFFARAKPKGRGLDVSPTRRSFILDLAMTAIVCLLRGVNLGGHKKISMQALRDICLSLKLRGPQTYIQSGNVVFATAERDLDKLARRIEDCIEKGHGFPSKVILRTVAEMRNVVARNPFAARKNLDPAKLVVSFLAEAPTAEAGKLLSKINVGPEELSLSGRELYIYFPDGQGRSKLPAVLDRTLKVPATFRNWNTVSKLLAMAEDLESAG